VTVRILVGDALAMLKTLEPESVQCCVTSPPYWGLRDYGHAGQLGLETTPAEYVAGMVAVFAEVRRVLRQDGTLWLNIGDSYTASSPGQKSRRITNPKSKQATNAGSDIGAPHRQGIEGMRPKNLIGIPWRLAFALQADGWYLRSDIVWAKPNGMPESVRDRPTRAHEMLFLLSKSERYFYNSEAARTPPAPTNETRLVAPDANGSTLTGAPHGRHVLGEAIPARQRRTDKQRGHTRRHEGFNDRWDAMEKAEHVAGGSNLRSVWWLAPAQFREGHFATMPPAMAEICIVAGTRSASQEKALADTVLDPFGGAGTTGLVADRLGRNAVLIELNPTYAEMARARIQKDNPMFASVEVA
jgi:DNA modification methylase